MRQCKWHGKYQWKQCLWRLWRIWRFFQGRDGFDRVATSSWIAVASLRHWTRVGGLSPPFLRLDGGGSASGPKTRCRAVLEAVLTEIISNEKELVKQLKKQSIGLLFIDIKTKIKNLLPNNTIQSVRKNVSHHYDVGNNLFKKMLDQNMLYTCAYVWCHAFTIHFHTHCDVVVIWFSQPNAATLAIALASLIVVSVSVRGGHHKRIVVASPLQCQLLFHELCRLIDDSLCCYLYTMQHVMRVSYINIMVLFYSNYFITMLFACTINQHTT